MSTDAVANICVAMHDVSMARHQQSAPTLGTAFAGVMDGSDSEAADFSGVGSVAVVPEGVALLDGADRGCDDGPAAGFSLGRQCPDSEYFGENAVSAGAVPAEWRACGGCFDRALGYGCGVPHRPYFEILGPARTAAGTLAESHSD